MTDEHSYALTTTWTGNRGTGTSGYRDYDRAVSVEVAGKQAGWVLVREGRSLGWVWGEFLAPA